MFPNLALYRLYTVSDVVLHLFCVLKLYHLSDKLNSSKFIFAKERMFCSLHIDILHHSKVALSSGLYYSLDV